MQLNLHSRRDSAISTFSNASSVPRRREISADDSASTIAVPTPDALSRHLSTTSSAPSYRSTTSSRKQGLPPSSAGPPSSFTSPAKSDFGSMSGRSEREHSQSLIQRQSSTTASVSSRRGPLPPTSSQQTRYPTFVRSETASSHHAPSIYGGSEHGSEHPSRYTQSDHTSMTGQFVYHRPPQEEVEALFEDLIRKLSFLEKKALNGRDSRVSDVRRQSRQSRVFDDVDRRSRQGRHARPLGRQEMDTGLE